MITNLQELADTSYAIAKSKGWWDKPRSVAALTLLMQSEISEALEDYRAGKGISEVWYEHKGATSPVTNSSPMHRNELGKPCGIPSELADVVIRIADFCGHYKLRLEPMELLDKDLAFDEALAFATREISDAFIALYASGGVGADTCLNRATQIIFDLAEANKIDLWKIIDEKAAFNKTREMLHGGKAI